MAGWAGLAGLDGPAGLRLVVLGLCDLASLAHPAPVSFVSSGLDGTG